jgi:hypothetical protein
VNLALAIIFFWLGAALMFVAFHPLSLESATGAPGDIVKSLRTEMQKSGNAYQASA